MTRLELHLITTTPEDNRVSRSVREITPMDLTMTNIQEQEILYMNYQRLQREHDEYLKLMALFPQSTENPPESVVPTDGLKTHGHP